MPLPYANLTVSDIALHLQFTQTELDADPDSLTLITAVANAATAHVESLTRIIYPVHNQSAPEEVVAAIKMLAGHLFENREAGVYGTGTFSDVPFGFDELIINYRTWSF